jgi:hypothetical protein
MNMTSHGGAKLPRHCSATNAQGKPCRMAPVAGSDPALCFTHSPARAPERARARKRGGEARRTPVLYALGPEALPLRDVASIQQLLETTVHETRALPPGHERSRAIGSLLMLALKALETGELEARLAALEEQITRPRRMA